MAQLCRALLALLLVISGTGPAVGRQCRDGWGRSGLCVSLRSCNSIHKLIRSKPSSEDITLIKKSICASQSRGVIICCATPTTTEATTTTTTTQAPLDLSQFDPNTPEGNPKRLLLPQWPICGSLLSERIVGGKEADLGEFPWLALLGFKEEETFDYYADYYAEETDTAAAEDAEPKIKFDCGGTLVSDRYVVTAAHCIPRPGQGEILKIRLGEHDLSKDLDCQTSLADNGDGQNTTRCSEPPVDIVPERIITHREFNKPFKNMNDIALIRLSQPVNFTRWISPICLPFGDWRTGQLPRDEAIVAGFGLTEAFGDRSKNLQKLDVPLVERPICRREFSKLRAKIVPSQICAGGNIGQDSCEGDSGGPLMMHDKYGPPFVLIGVTSFGANNCGQGATPGVYTKVAHYMDWILEKISP